LIYRTTHCVEATRHANFDFDPATWGRPSLGE